MSKAKETDVTKESEDSDEILDISSVSLVSSGNNRSLYTCNRLLQFPFAVTNLYICFACNT